MKQPETPEEIAAYEAWSRSQVTLPEERAAYIAKMTADIKAIEGGEVPDGFAGLIRIAEKDALSRQSSNAALDLEMKRIKSLFEKHSSDAEDLVTYAREIVGLRLSSLEPET